MYLKTGWGRITSNFIRRGREEKVNSRILNSSKFFPEAYLARRGLRLLPYKTSHEVEPSDQFITARKQKATSDFFSVISNVTPCKCETFRAKTSMLTFVPAELIWTCVATYASRKVLIQTTTRNFQGRTMTWTSFWEGTSYTYYTDNLVIAKSHSWFSLTTSRAEHTVELVRSVLKKYDAYVIIY